MPSIKQNRELQIHLIPLRQVKREVISTPRIYTGSMHLVHTQEKFVSALSAY